MTTSNDKLRDLANEHSVYLRGYSTRTALKVAELIEASEADLLSQLLSIEKKLTASPLTERRLKSLLSSAYETNARAYAEYYDFLAKQGKGLSGYEAELMAREIAAASRTPLDGIKFELSPYSKKNKERLVWIKTAEFDAAWKKSKEFYVGEGGEGAIKGRIERFKEFLAKNHAMQVSEVQVNEDGSVIFANGRHRYSVLRDGGTDKIPVAMSSTSIKNAADAGYLTNAPDPLTGNVSVSLGATLSSPELIFAAVQAKPFEGRLLASWVEGMSAARIDRVETAIRMGIVEGQTIDEIIRRLKGTRAMNYTDGILDISRRSAKSMAITYISHVSSAARQQVFESNSTLLKGVEWVSTLDGRTSSVCQARDGEVYPTNSGPRPPAHIGCRSTTIPVLKSWKELGIDIEEVPEGTRASMDGQVSAKETYQTWLAKKPADFQDHVLGKGKGELFRKGDLTLDKFVDLNGHALTLEQLQAK